MVKKTIGLLTGGGDVPGLNPCMKALVISALENDYRVIGIRRGWAGLLHYNLDEPSTDHDYVKDLNYYDVRTIDRTGNFPIPPDQPAAGQGKASPTFLKIPAWVRRLTMPAPWILPIISSGSLSISGSMCW